MDTLRHSQIGIEKDNSGCIYIGREIDVREYMAARYTIRAGS